MAKRTVTGSTRKTTGTIMAISLRPPASSSRRLPASRTSAAWARSTSASGVPRSIGDEQPVDEPGQRVQDVRSASLLQRVEQRRAGAGLGRERRPARAASSPPESRVTRASAPIGLSPAAHRERQQLGDDRELGEQQLLALLHLLGQPPVAAEHAADQHRRRTAGRPTAR